MSDPVSGAGEVVLECQGLTKRFSEGRLDEWIADRERVG